VQIGSPRPAPADLHIYRVTAASQAHGEAMEFASGLVELVRVANQYAGG
jgi:hypothetical protein